MNTNSMNSFITKSMAASLAVSAVLCLSVPSVAQEGLPERDVDESAIPEGYVLIEGDILVPETETTATFATGLWPGGILPFRFNANVNQTTQNLMLSAMAAWEGVANVDFRPRVAGDGNFLDIASVAGNVSWSEGVGMAGGQHDIRLSGFAGWGTMVHELGHALGYWHEQSRADRSTACSGGACIQVNDGSGGTQNNISAGNASQFSVRNGGGEYGPYDFDSIMHYGQCLFSCCNDPAPNCCTACGSCAASPANCATITVMNTNATWQGIIGQRTRVSKWDALVMSFLYPEEDWRFLDDECGDRGVTCGLPLFGCILRLGTFFCPFVDDFPDAVDGTPDGGALWILSDGTSYSTGGTLSKRMTIRAPLGAILTR